MKKSRGSNHPLAVQGLNEHFVANNEYNNNYVFCSFFWHILLIACNIDLRSNLPKIAMIFNSKTIKFSNHNDKAIWFVYLHSECSALQHTWSYLLMTLSQVFCHGRKCLTHHCYTPKTNSFNSIRNAALFFQKQPEWYNPSLNQKCICCKILKRLLKELARLIYSWISETIYSTA